MQWISSKIPNLTDSAASVSHCVQPPVEEWTQPGSRAYNADHRTQEVRELSKEVMAERTERFTVVNELWGQIEEIRMDLRRLHGESSSRRAPPSPAGVPGRQPADAAGHLEELRRDLVALRGQTQSANDQLLTSVRALQGSQRQLEARLSELAAVAASASSRPESATGLGGLAHIVRAGGSKEAALPPRCAQLLSERVDKQAADLAMVRHLLVEAHLDMPLQAIQMSRMTLRVPELSVRDRGQALIHLQKQEHAIRADLEKLRVRSEQQPEVVLEEVRKLCDLDASGPLA